MEVASGIDSQVIGDLQIIGQVRDAYQIAQQNESLGKMLYGSSHRRFIPASESRARPISLTVRSR